MIKFFHLILLSSFPSLCYPLTSSISSSSSSSSNLIISNLTICHDGHFTRLSSHSASTTHTNASQLHSSHHHYLYSSFCIANGPTREQLQDNQCNISLASILFRASTLLPSKSSTFPSSSSSSSLSYSKELCHVASIFLPSSPIKNLSETSNEMNSLLDTYDENINIRRIIIKLNLQYLSSLSSSLSSFNHTTNIFGEYLDQLLTPRPWWRILEEYSNKVILERISTEYEPHMKFLTSIYFPSSDTCSRTPLLIGRYDCIHPGWGAVLGMYHIAIDGYPYLILQPYVSRSNDYNENTAFITGTDCPNQRNKWLCAFLLSTNCTLPSLVTDCNTTNCIPNDNYQFTTFYSHANHTGYIIDIEHISQEIRHEYQTNLYSKKQKELSKYWIRPKNRYIMPYDQTVYTSRWPSLGTSYPPAIHYLLLRPNIFYRKLIMNYLKRFYDSTYPPFKSTDTCTAMHFRRGDRATAMDHNDIREICYNMTHEPKMCLDYNQQLHRCNSIDDYSCAGVPFGLLDFNRSVSHIESLIGPISHQSGSNHPHHSTSHTHHTATSAPRHNVILLSDDYQWLVTEVGKLKYSNLNLYLKYNFYIPPPDMLSQPLHSEKRHHDESFKDYFYMRANSGTQSGVYFHSSIKLIQQCNSFIGHMGSSVTRLFYSMMCHYHNGLEGYCPPLFNLEWEKEYYDGVMHDYWDKLGLKYDKPKQKRRM